MPTREKIETVNPPAALYLVPGEDHSFRVATFDKQKVVYNKVGRIYYELDLDQTKVGPDEQIVEATIVT